MTGAKRIRQGLAYIILVFLAFVFLAPIFIIVMNSFKGNFYISDAPFTLPRGETFAGFDNFVKGFTQSDFMRSFGNSAFITVFAVAGIVLLTSMTAWYIVRVKNKLTSALYYLFIFSMIVPFQMVMYTMTYFAFELRLNNPIGIVLSISASGRGCRSLCSAVSLRAYRMRSRRRRPLTAVPSANLLLIVFLILKPTAITVAILNAMWVWNDYLLPYLVLGSGSSKTLPVAVQMALTGGYGNKDMGALMAMLVLSILPIIIFIFSVRNILLKAWWQAQLRDKRYRLWRQSYSKTLLNPLITAR